jgi:hypothetical protein
MIRKIDNKELLALLEDRDELFLSVKEPGWDDRQLARYYDFMKKYNSMTQLQKDLYILYIKIGSYETASKLGVSQRFVNYKIKEIKDILK